MKRWVLCLLYLLGTFGTCLMMFVLKYTVINREDELKAIHRQIIEDSRAIHILEAEWAVENHPKRLMELVKNQTRLEPIVADQIQEVKDLPEKPVVGEEKP